MTLIAPHRVVAEIPQALAVPALAAVKVPAAPNLAVVGDAKATSGAAAAPVDGNVPRRVSARTNKKQ